MNLYKPGKPIEETKREFSLSEVVKLASNENPLGPSPSVLKSIRDHSAEQHLYPDPSQFELLTQAENFFSHSRQNIAFGNGTDEIIDFLVRIFCEKNDFILTSEYAFQAYEVSAMANQVKCLKAPVTSGMKFDLEAFISCYEQHKEKIKIIFISNPNNPTGTILSSFEFISFLDYFKNNEEVLIVADEAYVEFVRDPNYKSLSSVLLSYNNLVVLRTFSKIFGMAGLRLGAMLGPTEVIDAYNRMRKPFNVSSLAQTAGIAAMRDKAFVKQTQKVTWSGIDFFYKELAAMGIPFVPSEGNFILFETPVLARIIFSEMLKLGVILRPVDNYGLPYHLRMSVGLESENRKAIQCLQKVFKKLDLTQNQSVVIL